MTLLVCTTQEVRRTHQSPFLRPQPDARRGRPSGVSPRVAATLVSLVLLGAGCSGVPPERSAAAAHPTPSATSVPVSPGTSPTKPAHAPRRLTLLPPSCRDSQLRLGPWGGEGAGGWLTAYIRVTLVSAHRCTMRGFPRVRLIDTESRLLPLHYQRSEDPARPIVVTRRHPGILMVAKYRCDIACSPRRTDIALITLPRLRVERSLATRGRIPICAPRDPSHTVAVWPLSSNGPRLHPPYAASAGGSVVRHPAATWSRGDLNGDGRSETVVVRRTGELTVRGGGARLTRRVRPSGPAILQGVSDLDADGRAEILVVTMGAGCCGNRPTHGTTSLYRLEDKGVDRLGALPFSSGSGDRFTALRCGDGNFVYVSAFDPGVDDRWRAVVATMLVEHDQLVTRSVENPWLTGGLQEARAIIRTTCPGLTSDGWAIR